MIAFPPHDRFPFYLLFLVFLVCTPLTGQASSETFVGHWEGEISIPNQPLEIRVVLESSEDELQGTISIPAQGAQDLPLDRISVEGNDISFRIQGIAGNPTFEGAVSEASEENRPRLTGTFYQSGGSFDFVLRKTSSPASRGSQKLENMDATLESARKQFGVPGLTVAVVTVDEIIKTKGYGERNLESGADVNEETLFAIGSCTKGFTATLLAGLVEEEKLSWNRPVRQTLSDLDLQDPVAARQLTLTDMLTHRSGLPRHDLMWYGRDFSSRKSMVRKLRHLPFSASFREKFQYNNLLYGAAGYMAGTVTDSSWERLMRNRLLDPLQMDRTQLRIRAVREVDNRALPYTSNEDDMERIPYRPLGAVAPAGSIQSCASDMARWLQFNLNRGVLEGQRIISESTLRDLQTPHMAIPGSDTPHLAGMSYGKGWMISHYRGHRIVFHGGGIDGFTSRIALFPEEGYGIFAAANAGSSLPLVAVRTIADRLLDEDPINWEQQNIGQQQVTMRSRRAGDREAERLRNEGTSPSRSVSHFTGTYEHPAYGTIQVKREDKKLRAQFHGENFRLKHWHHNVFQPEGIREIHPLGTVKFQFRLDLYGQISSVDVPLEPTVKPITFERLHAPWMTDPDILEKMTGTYRLQGQQVTVKLRDETPVITFAGRRMKLRPVRNGWFKVEQQPSVRVRFIRGEVNGEIEKGDVRGFLMDLGLQYLYAERNGSGENTNPVEQGGD